MARDVEFDAAVRGALDCGSVAGDRSVGAPTARREAFTGDTTADQLGDGLGGDALGQATGGLVVPTIVGVGIDPGMDAGCGTQDGRGFVEEPICCVVEATTAIEVHAVREPRRAMIEAPHIWAAVVIVDLIPVLRYIAAVDLDPVLELAVAVGPQAGCELERVQDAITVVVAVDAAVFVLEMVEILALIGAKVVRVDDAVVVAVGG